MLLVRLMVDLFSSFLLERGIPTDSAVFTATSLSLRSGLVPGRPASMGSVGQTVLLAAGDSSVTVNGQTQQVSQQFATAAPIITIGNSQVELSSKQVTGSLLTSLADASSFVHKRHL